MSDLHDQIMNISAKVPEDIGIYNCVEAYREGHRDARRAAAQGTREGEGESTEGLSSSVLLSGVRWPSNEMRSMIVPVVDQLCDERDRLYEELDLLKEKMSQGTREGESEEKWALLDEKGKVYTDLYEDSDRPNRQLEILQMSGQGIGFRVAKVQIVECSAAPPSAPSRATEATPTTSTPANAGKAMPHD